MYLLTNPTWCFQMSLLCFEYTKSPRSWICACTPRFFSIGSCRTKRASCHCFWCLQATLEDIWWEAIQLPYFLQPSSPQWWSEAFISEMSWLPMSHAGLAQTRIRCKLPFWAQLKFYTEDGAKTFDSATHCGESCSSSLVLELRFLWRFHEGSCWLF